MIATTFHRFRDRVRPWAAPEPRLGAPAVGVIGAGPAGLASAALLRQHGVRSTVFDRSDTIGGSWPDRYDSLRLNTVRWMSDLPGLRMHRSLGRWVGRDEVAAYLRQYADHHRLDVRLGADGDVKHIDRDANGRWRLDGDAGSRIVDGVVVATGHSRVPVVPDWPGATEFEGRLLHAGDYRRPSDHDGARVLVVGAGSSGGEICVDLARAGIDVTWAVRTAPQVFPREILGVPATPFAPPAEHLPDAVLDRAGAWVERRVYGPRDYLPPATTPMMELFARCKEPMTADGIVGLIRSGRVEVVDAVDDLVGLGARLVDGSSVPADHVIAATGYQTGLAPLVGHLGVIRDDGRPRATHPEPGLGFVGFRIPFTGTLWAIEQDARVVAAAMSADLV